MNVWLNSWRQIVLHSSRIKDQVYLQLLPCPPNGLQFWTPSLFQSPNLQTFNLQGLQILQSKYLQRQYDWNLRQVLFQMLESGSFTLGTPQVGTRASKRRQSLPLVSILHWIWKMNIWKYSMDQMGLKLNREMVLLKLEPEQHRFYTFTIMQMLDTFGIIWCF